jgi:Ca2+-binding RTX toxin-like protein
MAITRTALVGGAAGIMFAASLGVAGAAASSHMGGTELQARMCRGHAATIVGTSGGNEIDGTAGRDVILGRGGNDDIKARGGNDLVCAGRGADEMRGNRGNDRLIGGRGFDQAKGGRGNDICRAEEKESC